MAEEYQSRLEYDLLHNPAPVTADDAAFDILSKFSGGSRTKLNQAQIDSFNYVCLYGLQKIVEGSKIWPCRVADDYYVFVFDRVYADKPFRIEQNGIKHNQSIQESFNRQATYKSPFYISLTVWMWSQSDPRTPEKRAELIMRKKKIVRMASKAKRIRVEQFEMSSVQNLERKRDKRKRNDEFAATIEDRDDEKEIRDEDFQGFFQLDDPIYAAKREQGHQACRFNAHEKNNYPYLISKMTWPKHMLVEIPIMPDSLLCHSLDEVSKILQCVHTAGGSLISAGLEHPFMRTYRLCYNQPFLFNDDDELEIRSGHASDKLRSSSSTLKLGISVSQTYNHEYLYWIVPYVPDQKVPLDVLFKALDVLDRDKVAKIIKFQVKHFFRKEKYIPMDKVDDIISWSLDHHELGSEKITTQKDAMKWLGKLADKQVNDEFVMELIKSSEDDVENEEKKKKQRIIPKQPSLAKKKRDAALAAAAAAGIVLPQRHERDQNEIWTQNGFTMMVREILPHVGSNFKRAAEFWKPKAMHLAYYCAKKILSKVRKYSVNPAQFISLDMRDTIENRRIQLNSEWILNNLLRGTLTNHFKMFRRDCIGLLHNDESIEPKTSLDHKRPTNIVESSLATGIIKSRIHPALVASQFKNGKQNFRQPERRQNNNNNNKQGRDRTGITAIINTNNWFSATSQQVRVNGNLKSTGGHSTAREILDHYRVIDFCETPDNKGIGIIFPHAIFSRVSMHPMTDELLTEVILSKFKIISISKVFDEIDELDFSRPVLFETERSQTVDKIVDYTVPSCADDRRLIAVEVNGRVLGFADAPTIQDLTKFLRENRYRLMDETFLSVANPLETRNLALSCDEGRFCSALFTVRKLPKLLSPTDPENGDWRPLGSNLTMDQMLKEGFIEFVDKKEENNDLFICQSMKDFMRLMWIAKHTHKDNDLSDLPYTHCEIHAVLTLGIGSANCVLAEYNQVARVTYGTNMQKQAMGPPYMNSAVRTDNLQHSLIYNNLSLVKSEGLRFYHAEETSPGALAFGAICCYYNKTPEDAIMINAGAAQRGFGRSVQTNFTTLNEMKLNSMHQAACFRRSNRRTTAGMKTHQYSHLDNDGFPHIGEMLTPNHIMISRTRPLEEKFDGELKYYDMSAQTLKKNAGIVTKVMLTSDDKGQRKVRVQTSKLCRLIKGDKVCSRHAQKHIIEEMTPEEDFIRTEDGLIPTFLFNPHGIPSRMSVAHILEMLGGLVAVTMGKIMNGTPFARQAWKNCMDIAEKDFEFLFKSGAAIGNCDLSQLETDEDRIQVMANALKMKGFKQQYGEQIFYNGITGERMGAQGCNERGAGLIFFGPITMYKLVHLAPDKLHSRSTGIRNSLTRQPIEGSKWGGGYRVAEMELNCISVHGAAYLLRERNFLVSDPFCTHFCSKCGLVCEANMVDHFYYCKVCKSNENTGRSFVPYSFVLLAKHLIAAAIVPRYVAKRVV